MFNFFITVSCFAASDEKGFGHMDTGFGDEKEVKKKINLSSIVKQMIN